MECGKNELAFSIEVMSSADVERVRSGKQKPEQKIILEERHTHMGKEREPKWIYDNGRSSCAFIG